MNVRIMHYTRSCAVTASTATASATTIRCDGMAGGIVAVAGASTNATRIAIHGSVDDLTYAPLHGVDGAAVEVVLNTATAGTYTLPDALYGVRFIRLVPDADLGTAAAVVVTIKS